MKFSLLKKKINKVDNELLLTLQKFEVLTLAIAMSYGRLHYSIASYYRGMRDLQKKGLVNKKTKVNQNAYVLTEKGKQVLKKLKLPVARTDGMSTIIIFDIPETKANERRIFRRYLIHNGYTLLQRSVLVSNNKISGEVKELVRELKIGPYVTSFDGKITYLI